MSIARLDSWLAILSLTCLIPIWALAVASEEPKDTLEELRDRDYSIGSITPIYQELVRFSLPARFKHAYEKDSGSFYIEEFVPNGETVDTWSQMITVTGSKGLAANESATPQRLAEQVAAGIQRACPATFAAKAIGTLKISSHDAFIGLVGCGEVKKGAPRSEIAMLITIKGTADYYSIQWAVRSTPVDRAPVLNGEEWLSRLKQLQPIRLCPRVPGESAPYPSCVNKKD